MIKRKSPLKPSRMKKVRFLVSIDKNGYKGKWVPKKRRKRGEITLLKKKLWELCKQITRRKYGNICYTCKKGPLVGSSWQTGHFITSSICSVELRFDLKNLAIQCYNCNIDKSGNWVVFEELLRKEYGDAYVEELKTRNLATKGKVYPVSWFQDKIAQYQKLI